MNSIKLQSIGITFMNRIKQVLVATGAKQFQLAQQIGMSKYSLSFWRCNIIQPPIIKMFRINVYPNCVVSYLLDKW